MTQTPNSDWNDRSVEEGKRGREKREQMIFVWEECGNDHNMMMVTATTKHPNDITINYQEGPHCVRDHDRLINQYPKIVINVAHGRRGRRDAVQAAMIGCRQRQPPTDVERVAQHLNQLRIPFNSLQSSHAQSHEMRIFRVTKHKALHFTLVRLCNIDGEVIIYLLLLVGAVLWLLCAMMMNLEFAAFADLSS